MILVIVDICRNPCSDVFIPCTLLFIKWPSTCSGDASAFPCIIIPVTKKLLSSAQVLEHHQMYVFGSLAHRSLGEKHKAARIERMKYTQNGMARGLSQGAPQGGVASPKERFEVLEAKSAHGGELIPGTRWSQGHEMRM